MRIFKRFLSLLICCILIISSIVGNASAIENEDMGVASLPNDLPAVKFTAYSLTLYDNIAINFKVSADTSTYSNVYVLCEFNGQGYKLTKYGKDGENLVFSFKQIAPNKLSDVVKATIFVEYDGTLYKAGSTSYSVLQYIKNVLPSAGSSKLRTLLVDLLNYGAAAQTYTSYNTSNLVNSWLSATQKAYGTQNSREYVSFADDEYEIVDGATANWYATSLALKDAISIRYSVDLSKLSNLEGVYAKFTTASGIWTVNSDKFVKIDDSKYQINFNKLNAAQLSDMVLATIYDKNGNAISNTFSYSVESYVARQISNKDAKLVSLIDAMMKYGDSALNYVYGENGNDSEFLNSGVTLDFENGSYTTGGANASADAWSVVKEGNNSVLKLTKGGSSANQWGFMLSTNKEPLIAGKTYKIKFKVKAGAQVSLDYVITSGVAYYTGNYNRDVYYVTDPSTGAQSSPIFPSAGNKVTVGTSWKEVETYFTAESYKYNGTTYTTPELYIVNRFWNIPLYFDDIEITPCQNAVNFNLYDTKFAKPSVGNQGDKIVMVPPERKGYIFDGWYIDKNFKFKFTDTQIFGNKTAYAKWIAAVTETEIGNIANGVTDLGVRVTNANSYPIKFALNTNGKVTISVFTASSKDDAATKSVVWKRSFTNSGDMGALINPAVIKGGDKLYILVEPENGVTASISNFVIGKAVTLRVVSGDVDGNNKFNADDLTALQGMSNGTVTRTWLGDIDDDGVIATADDITALSNMLNNIVETEKYGRQLVWSEEFSSGKLNGSVFGYHNGDGANQVFSDNNNVINYYDGNVNFSVSNIDGTDYSVGYRLVSDGKFEFKRGYLEVRAKINGAPGQWAGIWLSGEKDGFDHLGEIDIVETTGGTSFKPNVHSWDNTSAEATRLAQYGDKATYYKYSEQNFNTTEYHIFGFEWNETELKFYVDGVLYETMKISYFENYSTGYLFNKKYPYRGIFEQFYSIRLENFIYPENVTADGVLPEFSVDYVRLYQKAGEQFKINGVIQ